MKILYLIHVSWEWIFQRPQILGLQLQEDFDCSVISTKVLFKENVTRNNILPKKMRYVYMLRGSGKLPFIKKINNALYKHAVKACKEYDAIWICHPSLYRAIPADYKGKIIYDCMDNHVAMTYEKNRQSLFDLEQELLKRADLVFVSSAKLLEVIPNIEKAKLVRNGYKETQPLPVKNALKKETYKVGYFGTISSWLDMQLLRSSAVRNKGITYHLIGPIEKGTEINPGNANAPIVYEGVVEHELLGEYVSDYDALMMPFMINDITLSVDPVKLYEYICFGNCIVSVWYPEIERFEPFVYFYHNEEEYIQLMDQLAKEGFPAKYTTQQQEAFLKDNSWEQRYKVIKEEIEKLMD